MDRNSQPCFPSLETVGRTVVQIANPTMAARIGSRDSAERPLGREKLQKRGALQPTWAERLTLAAIEMNLPLLSLRIFGMRDIITSPIAITITMP